MNTFIHEKEMKVFWMYNTVTWSLFSLYTIVKTVYKFNEMISNNDKLVL